MGCPLVFKSFCLVSDGDKLMQVSHFFYMFWALFSEIVEQFWQHGIRVRRDKVGCQLFFFFAIEN